MGKTCALFKTLPEPDNEDRNMKDIIAIVVVFSCICCIFIGLLLFYHFGRKRKRIEDVYAQQLHDEVDVAGNDAPPNYQEPELHETAVDFDSLFTVEKGKRRYTPPEHQEETVKSANKRFEQFKIRELTLIC